MAYDDENLGESTATVLAFGLIYAAMILGLRLVSGGDAVDPPLAAAYRVGALLGFPGTLALGCLLGLPLYPAPHSTARRLGVVVVGTVFFALQALDVLGLPHGGTMAAWVAGYVLVASLGHRPLAARLVRREAAPGARVADAVAIAALSAVTLVTLVQGSGATWVGAAGPVARMLGFREAARETDLPPAPAERPSPSGPQRGVPPDVMAKVQGLMGVEEPTPIVDPRIPYCRAEPPPPPFQQPRSLILLLLENVANRELDLQDASGPLMPQLRRIAGEGARFERFLAASDRPQDALVAAMSGIPPTLGPPVVAAVPMPSLTGVGADLAREGFHTAFAFGTDPSVDALRPFLRDAGLATVIEPPLDAWVPGAHWGRPDGQTLTALRSWVESVRAAEPRSRYFAVFESLSTRPPYSLPGEAPGPDDEEGEAQDEGGSWAGHLAAVRYLDAELGRFYDWFLESEAPKGTVLLVAGTNQAPLAPPSAEPASPEPRFGVPLVVAGLRADELDRAREHAERPGSHVDLPQTLLGLVGSQHRGCYQGRDLLEAEPIEWPLDRLVVSVGGARREHLYVRHGADRWMFGRPGTTPTSFDVEQDPSLRRDLFAPDDPDATVLQEFTDAYRAIDDYMRVEKAYRPSRPPVEVAEPLPHAERTLRVSAGGLFEGVLGGDQLPSNSVPAVGQAIAAGFPWIEVEVHATEDGVPFVAGRNVLELGRLHLPPGSLPLPARAALPFSMVTSEQVRQLRLPFEPLTETLARAHGKAGLIVTIDARPWSPERVDMVRAMLLALRDAPAGTQVMVRSTDLSVLVTVSAFTDVPTVFTTGGRAVDGRLLDFLAEEGVDVVDLSTPILSAGLLADAHARGIRVMSPASTLGVGGLAPDFAIAPNLAPPPSP